MKPFYQDTHILGLYNKDCRDMSELQDNSVQCVVTSPPYWGLRKYSGEQDLIWGPADCNHQWQPDNVKHDNLRYRGEGSIVGNERNRAIHPVDSWKDCDHQWEVGDVAFRESHNATGKSTLANANKGKTPLLSLVEKPTAQICSLCGAWKGAFGLEPTPEMYIQHTIEILREIRRVLRKDGVVFWNIGDSYYGSGGDHKEDGKNDAGFQCDLMRGVQAKQLKHNLLKPKDLCLIPFRLAIAAQEDGWWVRSVIIWSKPNPMPESVTDRPTESHEYILMLTKSARYYWDADAVRDQYTEPMNRWGGDKFYDTTGGDKPDNINRLSRADRLNRPNEGGRNIRTVWEFPTQPYPEAHFAVFPEKLPEICIKAATPEVGCCSKCGAPWERINEPSAGGHTGKSWHDHKYDLERGQSQKKQGSGKGYQRGATIGWQPTCKCEDRCGEEGFTQPYAQVPSLVLDPFAGAGTTLWVAKKLNRRAVGYEISGEYCELALKRNRQQVLGL